MQRNSNSSEEKNGSGRGLLSLPPPWFGVFAWLNQIVFLFLLVLLTVTSFASYQDSVLEATKQVNGKGQNSTPRHAQTPLPIFTKIGMHDYVLDGTRHAKFVAIVFAPKYVILTCSRGWPVLTLLGICNSLQPTPLNGFLRKIRQKTSFRPRMYLLGVLVTIFDI